MCNFKKDTNYLKKDFLWNAAKTGYQYIFACKADKYFFE